MFTFISRFAMLASCLLAFALVVAAGWFAYSLSEPRQEPTPFYAEDDEGPPNPACSAVSSQKNAASKHHAPRAWTSANDPAPRALAFSPLGDRIAVVGSDKGVLILDAATGKQLLVIRQRLPDKQARSFCSTVAYSPGGQWMAAAGDRSPIQMWCARTGEKVRRFTAPWPLPADWSTDLYNPAALAFSPDGAILATLWSTSGRDFILFVETATGKRLKALPLPAECN